MPSCRIGSIAFDPRRLDADVETILSLTLHHCRDGVGDWMLRTLWGNEDPDGDGPEVRRRLGYLDRTLNETFAMEHANVVRVFAARGNGFIRPHRDAPQSQPAFTRLHLPLRTHARCFNSEDDVVYHMEVGEVWYLDGSRPHSGGCFSERMRVHLVIDFPPELAPHELFRDPARYRPEPPSAIERAPLLPRHLAALRGLARIADVINVMAIVDVLATVHFEKQADCAAVYDWLRDIAAETADSELVREAERITSTYLVLRPMGAA